MVTKKKKLGRPPVRDWSKVPPAAKNTAIGKTRRSFIIKITSIEKLLALAEAEGNQIGTELEICIDDRAAKYEKKNGKLWTE